MMKAIHTKSAHHCLVWPDKMIKETHLVTAVVWRVRRVDLACLTSPILHPIPISYQLGEAFILNNNEENT